MNCVRTQAEELLAAKAHKRVVDEANSDPLENFCKVRTCP